MTEFMNTREVALYLRIKERKVYDLVRRKRIPCTRASGKWLFPKHLIDSWLTGDLEPSSRGDNAEQPPPVIAGSHDPLLDWAMLESGCGLALLGGGSLNGLERFAAGQALACGLHVLDGESGRYNVAAVQQACGGKPPDGLVLIEWAKRRQGLIVAAGNPMGISGIGDLALGKARVTVRQPAAGSRILFDHLIAEAGIGDREININGDIAKSETELGRAVADGHADAGLGLAAVARQFGLDFLPLCYERFDVLIRRRDYFEPPFQQLVALTRTEAFAIRAGEMHGYDISGCGGVHLNI